MPNPTRGCMSCRLRARVALSIQNVTGIPVKLPTNTQQAWPSTTALPGDAARDLTDSVFGPNDESPAQSGRNSSERSLALTTRS